MTRLNSLAIKLSSNLSRFPKKFSSAHVKPPSKFRSFMQVTKFPQFPFDGRALGPGQTGGTGEVAFSTLHSGEFLRGCQISRQVGYT